jgi:Sulfotransferase family
MPEFPNFIILGAQKSGTTTLHNVVSRHPEIFMSRPVKEPGYFFSEEIVLGRIKRYKFSEASNRAELLSKYMRQGYDGEPVFGESTTAYTFGTAAEQSETPRRMFECNPDMKFVYIMRHPFERLLSGYRHAHRHSDVGTFRTFLDTRPGKMSIETSCYFYQLSMYFKYFDRKQFHLMAFEDFVENQSAAVQPIYAHLGLQPYFTSDELHKNKAQPHSAAENLTTFPQPVLDLFYDRVTSDLARLKSETGFDTDRWDISRERWTTSGNSAEE